MLPKSILALVKDASEGSVQANDAVTQLALVLERSSVPGGGAGIDRALAEIHLSQDQRDELIIEIGSLLEQESVRVSALWALGKGNSRLCLDLILAKSQDAMSVFCEMAILQWLLSLENLLAHPSDYEYPEEFLSTIEKLATLNDPEITNVAQRIMGKLDL